MAKCWRYTYRSQGSHVYPEKNIFMKLHPTLDPKSVPKVKDGKVKITLKNPFKNFMLEISKSNTAAFSSSVRTKQHFFG